MMIDKQENIDIVCPKCGKKFSIVATNVLDANKDIHLKKCLFSLGFFADPCPKCGHMCFTHHDFIYRDEERKFQIYYMENPTNILLADEPGGDIQKQTIETYGATTERDLLTMIVALENGLDWRIMMILQEKILHLQVNGDIKLASGCEPKMITNSYFKYSNNDLDKKEIVYATEYNDGISNQRFITPFSKEAYDGVYEKYIERMNEINPRFLCFLALNHYLTHMDKNIKEWEKNKIRIAYVIENGTLALMATILDGNDIVKEGDVVVGINDSSFTGTVMYVSTANPATFPFTNCCPIVKKVATPFEEIIIN